MLLAILLSLAAADTCKNILSQEGQSLIQLLIGDYTDQKMQSTAAQQLMYSGKDLNDLGHWSSCNRLKSSRYLIANLNLLPLQTKIGLCVPKECSAKDIKELISGGGLSEHPKLKASWSPDKIHVFEPETEDATTGTYVAWIGIFMLLGIVAYGTYLDLNLSKPKSSTNIELGDRSAMPSSESISPPRRLPKYILLIQCFSFPRNWGSLFVRPFQDSTVFLDGVRSLSIIWIVMGHVLLTRFTDVIYNIEDVPDFFQSYIVTLWLSPTLAVDTFFWLAGFLLGYLILDEAVRSKGRIRWGMSVVGRVLRMWPTYIFILVLVNFIISDWGHGPKWDQVKDVIQDDCSEYWWTNLLFINNIYPWATGNYCIGQSWYLAADIQIFLMTIPVIIVYLKFPKHYAWILTGLLLLSSLIYRLVMSSHYKIYISFLNPDFSQDKYNYVHTNGFARIAPYFTGIFSGFVMNYRKNKKSNDFIVKFLDHFYSSKIKAYISFVLGFVLFNIALWVPYKAWSDKDGDFMGYSTGGNVAFMGFYNLLSAFGYSFMFLPMLYEMIPLASLILSLDIWIPIAKSTFSIYFIHICIIRLFVASEESATMFTKLTIVTDFVFMLTLSILAGMIVYTCIECPFGKVVKLLLTRERPPQRKDQPLLSTELKEQAIN